ncbi:MAG TPA: GMC family oxidoreductase N-terminal domain-containing protein [Mycobacterium sp.]|nr:GMC family oxidoreductase N-terminal domain-containing protein [Mycobacterium sp.]
MNERYDTIIVGAGAAGCVLANRLSADGQRRVLLLEAGPDYGPDPTSWPAELLDPSSIWPTSHDWGYADAGRDPATPFALPRSRIVGGTTTVNGCVWLRGSASDFDGWAALGNTGWGFQDVLPYFKRAENDPLGGPLAGEDGPVPVYRLSNEDLAPAERAFMTAAEGLGLPIVADLNRTARQTPCVGAAPKNIADGIRMNGAFTYLAPARTRPNLSIHAATIVDCLTIENGRASGVRTVDGQVVQSREVVLCAGTYGSPAILLRSGIGPATHLRELGIPVVRNLIGVGENLLDHPLVSPDRPRPRLVRPEYAPRKRSFIPVIAKAASRHAGHDIDLHIYIGQDFSAELDAWFLWITASLQYARSRGRLRLTSPDPFAPLDIDHAYLSDPADLEALCDGIDLAERIIAATPLQRVLEPVVEDAPPWSNATGLPPWVRAHAGTTYHPSSTCRMGPEVDTTAVVDHEGRVHGVAGVRVVDASIFPTGPRANLHFTVIAVAEKLADAMMSERLA